MDADLLLTWVPPFAPLEVVGLPPERASLPAERTEVPLRLLNRHGKGQVLFFAFELGKLLCDYALQDLYLLAGEAIKYLLGEDMDPQIEAPGEVIVTVFRKPKQVMLHFINGVGKRPLREIISLRGIRCKVKLREDERVKEVFAVIGKTAIPYSVTDNTLCFDLPELEIWEMVRIKTEG